jgi:hypothetical protein
VCSTHFWYQKLTFRSRSLPLTPEPTKKKESGNYATKAKGCPDATPPSYQSANVGLETSFGTRGITRNVAADNLNHIQRAIGRKRTAKRLCDEAEILKETARDLISDSEGYRADSQRLKKVARDVRKKRWAGPKK